MKIDVKKSVMEANNEMASQLRNVWNDRNLTVLNFISSPGAGKTTLLERTLQRLSGKLKAAVLVGDLQTENDARRLEVYGFPTKQIVTSGTCHLEAHMIEKHLQFVDRVDLDLLIIENVGNLVCPSSYDLGEDAKIVLLSTAEGEDKPLKYPGIFRRAEVTLLTKVDLVPHTDFQVELAKQNIYTIKPNMSVIEVSSRTGFGLDEWVKWLEDRVQSKKSRSTSGLPLPIRRS